MLISAGFSRISSITLHPTKAQLLCPGNQCRRLRQQLQWGKHLISEFLQFTFMRLLVYLSVDHCIFYLRSFLSLVVRNVHLERTVVQQHLEKRFHHCQGEMPGKYITLLVGNIVLPLGISLMVSLMNWAVTFYWHWCNVPSRKTKKLWLNYWLVTDFMLSFFCYP